MNPSRILLALILGAGLMGGAGLMAQGGPAPSATKPQAPLPSKAQPAAPNPPTPSADSRPKEWVVAKGDSLYTISQKTGVPLGRLQALNPKLHRRGELWVGDKVRLDGEVPASPKPKVGATNTRPEKPAAAPAPAPVQPAVLTPVAPTTVVAASVPTSMVAAAPRSAGVETLEDQEAVVRELRYVKEIVYNPDAVPEINCHVRTVQTLILPEGESIVNVQAGDDRVWGITPVVGKNVIFIKPLIAQKATNIVVATAIGNLYSFRLSSDMNRPPLYTLRVLPPDGADAGAGAQGSAPQGVTMPGAGVSYIGGAPMDSAETQRMIQETASEAARRAREDEQRKSKAREQALVESVMKDRNDDFKISYDWHTPFRIQNIFSASGVTYIRVIVPENRQPVLYVIDEGGKRTMANQQPSNVDPNLIIVDQTFRQAVLVLGKKEARISNVGLEKAIRAAKKREF